MDIMEQNKNRALAILKQFVFPVKNTFEKNMEDSSCTINVSLHEKNGMSIGGLPVNEQILEIKNISNRTRNIEMFERYLSNIDFIEIDSYSQTLGRCNTFIFRITFFPHVYFISELNKQFNYDEFPNENDMNFLLSEFKRRVL